MCVCVRLIYKNALAFLKICSSLIGRAGNRMELSQRSSAECCSLSASHEHTVKSAQSFKSTDSRPARPPSAFFSLFPKFVSLFSVSSFVMAQLLRLPEHLLEEVLKHLLNESEPSKYHVYSRWIAGTAALSGTCRSLRRRFGEEGKKAFAEFRAWQDEEEENQMPDQTSSDDGTSYTYM